MVPNLTVGKSLRQPYARVDDLGVDGMVAALVFELTDVRVAVARKLHIF